MTDLSEFARLVPLDHGLSVVVTRRADLTPQTSVVNAGVTSHPITGEPVVAFVAGGRARKLVNLRTDPTISVVLRAGWQWAAVEGTATLIGPDDPAPGVDDERLRVLLREIFTDNVEFDTTAFGNPPLRGIDAVIESYVSARHPVAHHVTGPVVRTDHEGTVRVRSKVLSLLGGGLCGSGTYDDVAVRTPDGWRIASRVIGLRRESDLRRPPPRPAS